MMIYTTITHHCNVNNDIHHCGQNLKLLKFSKKPNLICRLLVGLKMYAHCIEF